MEQFSLWQQVIISFSVFPVLSAFPAVSDLTGFSAVSIVG